MNKKRVSLSLVAAAVMTAGSVGLGFMPTAANAADAPITWYVDAGATKPGQRVGHDAGHTNTKGKGHTENASTVCPSRTDARPAVSTISGAIGCATTGDTISVGAGTFKENPIVDKSVTISGAGLSSVVDGGGVAAVMTVPAGTQATISGVALRNGTVGLSSSGDTTLAG